jgi:hypothetical protein
MPRAVIAYDKDLPEVPDRGPWERPSSFGPVSCPQPVPKFRAIFLPPTSTRATKKTELMSRSAKQMASQSAVSRPEGVLDYNRHYINGLLTTSPHGSDSNTLRELLELYRFERRAWHSSATPREGVSILESSNQQNSFEHHVVPLTQLKSGRQTFQLTNRADDQSFARGKTCLPPAASHSAARFQVPSSADQCATFLHPSVVAVITVRRRSMSSSEFIRCGAMRMRPSRNATTRLAVRKA